MRLIPACSMQIVWGMGKSDNVNESVVNGASGLQSQRNYRD